MNKPNKIQSHALQDIYRLEEGIILKINKYKSLGGYYGDFDRAKNKNIQMKKHRGIKNCFELLEDYEVVNYAHWKEEAETIKYEKGVFFYDDSFKKIMHRKDYFFELKVGGGAIVGTFDHIDALHNQIKDIMKSYDLPEEEKDV